ncbi:gustatory receptor 68a-like [Cylas formicarius]|uniref:gustatory receptor 68a-like n=1 Tax=Cylas formicarius TaxID=197179 RepID=UPI002958B73B|nr:gustatory receptor 68a-like [Cylas formicarius]
MNMYCIAWLSCACFKLTCLCCTSGSLNGEINETRRIASKMFNQVNSEQVKEEVEEFLYITSLLDSKFSPFGFFTLDYSLIRIVASKVTTYMIIAAQFTFIRKN